MRITRFAGRLAAAVVGALGVASALPAQGFGLNDVGTCAVARGYSATGAPCMDGSVIYWNPAAATKLKKFSIYAGANPIKVGGSFTQDTSGIEYPGDVPVEVPPHAFFNWTSAGGRLALGAGMYVPYGLTSQWKTDFPGRFQAQRASLKSIYIQPNVAFRFAEGWSIGGGPVIGLSKVELRQYLDLSQQSLAPPLCNNTPAAPCLGFALLGISPGTQFGIAQLKSDGWAKAYGFNVGIHGQILPTLSVGARYLSKLTFDYEDAKATFEQLNTGLVLPANGPLKNTAPVLLDTLLHSLVFADGRALTAQTGGTSIVHPWQLQVGVGFTGIARTTLSFDAQRVGWSDFKELDITFNGPAASRSRTLFEDYKDNWSYRVGAEYLLKNAWALRGGYSHVQTPAPEETVTPLLPDMDRNNFSAGLGIPLMGDRFALDAGYLYVSGPGRRGRISERTDRSQTSAQLNTGWYALSAHVFGLSLKANF